ncbi:hypothetical protein ACA910_015217 [Epithemia clementina (nom. ined.)]
MFPGVQAGFSSSAASSSAGSTARNIVWQQQRRVLCFGDSLTAGTSPPSFQNYPYAPYLEKALAQLAATTATARTTKSTTVSSAAPLDIVVRHAGFPGWTSSQLLENQSMSNGGLRTLIQGIRDPPLSLVILLAGTNDLGYQTEATPIANSILGLHKLCHNRGVPHTIAIGIPPSGYQSMVEDAQTLAASVNTALETFCQENSLQSTYVPFPFAYERNGKNWSPDGLHFSEHGAETVC